MYTVGEKVVHPMHGAGVISEITEERMSGKLERYYVFSAPLSGLTLKIPVANSGAVGLRRLISRQQLAETLASLREIEEDIYGKLERCRQMDEKQKAKDSIFKKGPTQQR